MIGHRCPRWREPSVPRNLGGCGTTNAPTGACGSQVLRARHQRIPSPGETQVQGACASSSDRRGRRRAKCILGPTQNETDRQKLRGVGRFAAVPRRAPRSARRAGGSLLLGRALSAGLRRLFRGRVRSAVEFSTLLVAGLAVRHSRARRRWVHPPRDYFIHPVAAGAGSKQGSNDHRCGKTHHERRLRDQGAQANGPKQGTLVFSLGTAGSSITRPSAEVGHVSRLPPAGAARTLSRASARPRGEMPAGREGNKRRRIAPHRARCRSLAPPPPMGQARTGE